MVIVGRARGGGGKRGEAVGLGGENFDNVRVGDFGSDGGTFAQHVDLEGNHALDGKKSLFHDLFLFLTNKSLKIDHFFCRLSRGGGESRGGRGRGSGGNRILEVSVGVKGNRTDRIDVTEHHLFDPSNQSVDGNDLFTEMDGFREVEDGGDGCFSYFVVFVSKEEDKGR